MKQTLPKSRALAAKVLYAAFSALRDNGGELPFSVILEEIPKRTELDEWALSRTEKSSSVRWVAYLSWFSVDCAKAGFLIKSDGVWYLTPEGEEAWKLGEVELLIAANKGYRLWKAQRDASVAPSEIEANLSPAKNEEPFSVEEENIKSREVRLLEVKKTALEEIKQNIRGLNPYEFQRLCAALFRGMGYYTPFVAPRGKDGGIDIIAYRDPLGASAPRMKIQVKHRQDAAKAPEIQQLLGVLNEDAVGIFISSGGFTADAKAVGRTSHKHIELIDLERFIALWQEFYPKLSDADKRLLPLVPVWFLAPLE